MTTRVALVTGGSSGIGEATALALREAGFEVYAVARRVDRMAGLEAAGVHAFVMDVTDDASMVAGIARVVAEQGRIDVLVNNAAAAPSPSRTCRSTRRGGSSTSTCSGWRG